MSEDAPVPECLACGACCFGNGARYVRVTGDDHARLGDEAERLVVWTANEAWMRMESGRCAALVIDAARGRFVCSIYEKRPQVCRDLERGGAACAAERWKKSDRALVALRRG